MRFYVTGETGHAATASINMSGGANVSAGTGNIMNVLSSSTASFTANGETLTGNFQADATSTLTATLQNGTSLTGSAQKTSITIDATSSWTVTGNSVMTAVIDPGGISGSTVTNIIGNGHNVHYDSGLAGNQYLGGLIYSLVNGGVLTPGSATGVEQLEPDNTSGCSLYQNFPNPVGSTTTVAFSLTEKAFVTLKIYDQVGKQVAVLVDSDQEAGHHEISYDVSSLGNGIYFYRLSAFGNVMTKKMVILK